MDGVLVVDKPAGPTSHDIVDRARRALQTRRVGHTGTLDPFATGVLALCVGRATRLARFLTAGEKAYSATVRLGFATTTDDLTGDPLEPERPVELAEAALREALAGLVGTFDQVPPAFSARQVGGRRLYELARRGEAVARAATPVTVYALELVARGRDTLELELRCSAGTYVRALARDLGERLGTGAHLLALRRTRSGGFDIGQAVPGDRSRERPGGSSRCRDCCSSCPRSWSARRGCGASATAGSSARSTCCSGFPEAPVERVRLLDGSGQLLALATPRGLDASASSLPRVPSLHPDVVLTGDAS